MHAKLHLSATHVVICVSMKIRMKTSRAGKQQANIIQMGNCPSEPRGLMIQPRFVGLVTEKPRGTLSFCTEGDSSSDADMRPKARHLHKTG